MTKEAVILAAGRGMRLGANVNGDPKCLIPFGDKVLLEHQLGVLEGIGIERIVVVVGHEADRVRRLVGDRCAYITNPRYAETNSLYSLWVAREHVTGPFMLLNSDVLAHPEVYHRVLAAGGTALAYDSSSGSEDEHMKVSFSAGRLCAISKSLSAEQTDGENVGILRFDREAATLLFGAADAIVASGDLRCWAPAAVDRIADRVAVRGVDVADLPWTEIDFPEDLTFALETVWPALNLAASRGHTGNPAGGPAPSRDARDELSAGVRRSASAT